jgi:hypothetical protein
MRRGVSVQNHSVNTDSFYVSDGQPTTDFASTEIPTGGALYEDILPMCGKIWAKAASGTPTMTLILKY